MNPYFPQTTQGFYPNMAPYSNTPYPFDPGYLTPGRWTSPINGFNQTMPSPSVIEHEIDQRNLSLRMKSEGTNKPNDDLMIMINAFKEQIFINRYIENLKEELARQRDFNLELLYSYFDENKSGKVDLAELREGFSKLEVMCSEKEAFSILRRYSRDKDQRLE
jgi:hypothetical protein